ncbi:MAG TPA: ABATE domain-containing protein [Chloroflexota bacterium]
MSPSEAVIPAGAGRAAGFTLVGEPLAVDLANTVKVAVTPPREFLTDDDANEAFWSIQSPRLPFSVSPWLSATLSLRSAVRAVLEATRTRSAPNPTDLRIINDTAALTTMTLELDATGTSVERWWAATPDTANLAAVARSAIMVAGGPHADRLRQCASPTCSQYFVATNSKRQWCTSDLCGNRQRVARFAHSQIGDR